MGDGIIRLAEPGSMLSYDIEREKITAVALRVNGKSHCMERSVKAHIAPKDGRTKIRSYSKSYSCQSLTNAAVTLDRRATNATHRRGHNAEDEVGCRWSLACKYIKVNEDYHPCKSSDAPFALCGGAEIKHRVIDSVRRIDVGGSYGMCRMCPLGGCFRVQKETMTGTCGQQQIHQYFDVNIETRFEP